jgi:SAM-dependent methyltransferase
MKRDDWNSRYADAGLVWGTEPNRFVAAELAGLAPGRALDLACGEGRNAIWLAGRGWDVTAVDFSDVAVERGRRQAAQRGVDVAFVVDDVLTVPLDEAGFDLVLVTYLQLPAGERALVLRRAAASLAPGGALFLVGHDLRNHAEGHGGPKDASLLWTADEVAAAVTQAGLTVERAGEVLREVDGAPRPAIDTLVLARRGP